MIKIVGMGLGDERTLTLGGLDCIKKADRVVLQTETVPIAQYLSEQGIVFETLDNLYESCEDFDQLNCQACEFVAKPGTVFCVLGSVSASQLVKSVIEVAENKGWECRILPGIDPAQNAAALSGIMGSYAQCSGEGFLSIELNTDIGLVITEVDSIYKAIDIKLRLLDYYPENTAVWVVEGQNVRETEVLSLDRLEGCNYSTCIALKPISLLDKQGFSIVDLCAIMEILREKCPWDAQQTHKTLEGNLLEESYEVLDALEKQDAHMLCDELGDLLLQVVFHAQLEKEKCEFSLKDVVDAICKKLIFRHTHVFGNKESNTGQEALANWEAQKRIEKSHTSNEQVLRDIPACMSQLIRAQKLQKKAETLKLENIDIAGAVLKTQHCKIDFEEAMKTGLNLEQKFGELLFSTVGLGRLLKINSEIAMAEACEKYIYRLI